MAYIDSGFKIHVLAKSAGALEYTDCISAEGNPLPTSVLDMKQKNMRVKFQ